MIWKVLAAALLLAPRLAFCGPFIGNQVTISGPSGATVAVTPGNALKMDGSASTQPVSGSVTVSPGTGPFTVVAGTSSFTVTPGTGVWSVSAASPFTVVAGTSSFTVTPGTGTWTVSGTVSVSNLPSITTVTFNGAPQPVSGSGTFSVVGGTFAISQVDTDNNVQVTNSTMGVVQAGGAFTVVQTTSGVNASTVTVWGLNAGSVPVSGFAMDPTANENGNYPVQTHDMPLERLIANILLQLYITNKKLDAMLGVLGGGDPGPP